MKLMVTQLLLLPLAITASVEDYFPDPQYDATAFQLKEIYDHLRIFDKPTLKNTFDEWITQHRTLDDILSVFNKSKRVQINFSKFIPDKDIVPISRLINIYYYFDLGSIYVFEPQPKDMHLEGNVQFLNPWNQSSCEITFNLNFTLSFDEFTIDHGFNASNEIRLEIPSVKDNNYTQTELDKNSCAKISEEERNSTYHYVLQAIETTIAERRKLIERSLFSPMLKWFYPDTDSNGTRQKLYSRFTPDGNTVAFPWKSDYNELIIRGLDNFEILEIEFTANQRPRYRIYFRDGGVRICWNIASMNLAQMSFEGTKFGLFGKIDKSMDNLTIKFDYDILELSNYDHTAGVNQEAAERLKKLMTDGIQQTLRKISYDGTIRFTNDMKKIIRPFDKITLKNFITPENAEHKINQNCTVSFSEIEIAEFHLENITRIKFCDNLEISNGTLIYKNMEAQVEIIYNIRKKDLLRAPISARIRIKQATIGISLQYGLNLPRDYADKATIINDDFDKADAIIQITSSYLQRNERIEVGNCAFEHFVEKIKAQTINRTKSIFRPIFETCDDKMNVNIGNQPLSNQLDIQRRYFTLIHDHWPLTVRSLETYPVEVFLNGVWNFDSINVHYVNEKLSIGGLRLENITGSIRQLDESNKTSTKNFTMNYLLININHAERQVSITHSSSFNKVSTLSLLFRSTVAFFIGHTIYADDSNYRTMLRKFVDETMTKAIREDTPFTYDASSMFAKNLTQILKNKEHSFLGLLKVSYLGISDYDSSRNDCSILTASKRQVVPQNTKISRCQTPVTRGSLIQEEICVYLNDSQNAYSIVEKVIINGTMSTTCYKPNPSEADVPFAIMSSNRKMKTFNNAYNENLQIYIDDKNVKDGYNLDKVKSSFDPTNETQTIELALLTSRLRNLLEKFSNTENFCKPSFSSITPLNEYFFSIKGAIDYPAQRFLMYHIKLYGLHHLKSLRMSFFKTNINKFEITVGNLKARVIWNYYMGEIVWKIPKIMNLQISNITLCGKIYSKKQLVISNRSQLHFSELEDYNMVNNFKKTFEPIVLNAIMKSIQKEYEQS